MLVNVENDNRELNVTVLEDGQEYSKICYLSDFKTGQSKLQQGFYTFYFKDCNANTVIGRLFNIADFVESGATALALKRKAVLVNFIAQEYNGSMTLMIKNIEPYSGSIDFKKFIGFMPDIDVSVAFVNQALERLTQRQISDVTSVASASFEEIAGGKCGGYAKLLQLSLQTIISYKGLSNIVMEDLGYVFYVVQAKYFNHLLRMRELDLKTRSEKIMELSRLALEIEDKRLSDDIVDTMSALLGLGKPERLYSNIVYDTLMNAKSALDIIDAYTSMVVGARKEINGKSLLKL